MDNYVLLDLIGEGAFGKVYRAQRKCTNQIVAIKKIGKKKKQEKELKNLRQEIEILRKLYHENVIQLLDSFETNTEICLVTELAQGQLYEILEEDKKLPETEIKFIARQLVAGLFYLHNNNIIHRDIKPQNVLISANGIIKICDFGFARAIESKAMITSMKGTPLYMAPELLREYPYNQKADLWSLGVIMYELFVGQPPFYTNSFPTLMNKIMNETIKYPDSMSFQFKDFLKGLLVKNHKERWDWNKILEHQFIKETDQDKKFRLQVQENYKKWIVRLKNEKVFNLYECESFLSKFSSDIEVDQGVKTFSAFDEKEGEKEKGGTFITSSGLKTYTTQNTLNSNKKSFKDPFWDDIESKVNKEEYATSLRKDINFSEKIHTTLIDLIIYDNDKIVGIKDKKGLQQIVRILFALLKGKFENQNIDITKNQEILKLAMNVFFFSQQEDDQATLNDIIKVIGLFAKFYCYYNNSPDLTFCATFIQKVPSIILGTTKPTNVHVNIIKAVGIMITAANMFPKKSLMFYRTFHDYNIVNILLQVIKTYKNVPSNYTLVRSAVECLAILVNPMNGEIFIFPPKQENEKDSSYIEYKTTFEHIEKIKQNFVTLFNQFGMNEIFPVLFECDMEGSLKGAILRVILQLLRNFPIEMLSYINTKGSYINLINNIFKNEDQEQKSIIHEAYLVLIEIVKILNSCNISAIEVGYEISKPANYINNVLSLDAITLCISIGLLAECIFIPGTNQYVNVSNKYVKSIKDIIKNVQGKGKEENKKLEGTSFGFLKFAIFDYPIMFLERIFKIYLTKDRQKHELIQYFTENQFDDVLVDLISNPIYKYDISPRGTCSAISLITDLLECDYKILFKKIYKDITIKSTLNYFKPKTFTLISEWPSYKKEEGISIAKNFYIANLKLIKALSDVNAISEDAIKSDFFLNLKSAFELVESDDYKYLVSIIHNLIAGGRQSPADEIVNNISTNHFSKLENLKFITQYNLLNDLADNQKDMIVEILIMLSSLCRKSASVYNSIKELMIFKKLKILIDNSDSSIKSKVCNLIGNMCRHSEFFYDEIKNFNIAESLIKCCYDSDRNTRKFACFAIGNAAFINDKLYESFRPSIKVLVQLLKDPEDNTRANSAGALGNFVRCGDTLCDDIVKYKAHEALLELAESEEISNPQLPTIKVALFALGNFCYHQSIKNELNSINFVNRIDVLAVRHRNEKQLIDHISRIKNKL